MAERDEHGIIPDPEPGAVPGHGEIPDDGDAGHGETPDPQAGTGGGGLRTSDLAPDEDDVVATSPAEPEREGENVAEDEAQEGSDIGTGEQTGEDAADDAAEAGQDAREESEGQVKPETDVGGDE